MDRINQQGNNIGNTFQKKTGKIDHSTDSADLLLQRGVVSNSEKKRITYEKMKETYYIATS